MNHDSQPSGNVTTTGRARAASIETATRRNARGRTLALCVLAIILVAAIGASLLLGWSWISPVRVWDAAFAFDGSHDLLVIRESRIQRTLAAVVVGSALGLAGAVMQAFTRNPLADPGLLGVSSGAGFGVTLAVFILGGMTMGRFIWFSLLGALLATILVSLLGNSERGFGDPIRVVLAGVAVGAVLLGLSDAFTVLDPDKYYGMRFWGIGSLTNLQLTDIGIVLPFIVAGSFLAIILAHPLNALALGDQQARSLGARVALVRVASIISVTLLAGAATALVGMIAFVGLVVPHIVRWYFGPDQRWVFPSTMLGSAVLVLVSDILGRFMLSDSELPVSIVLACLGSPVLIALARRRGMAEL